MNIKLPSTIDIDQRAEKLIGEFFAHYNEVKRDAIKDNVRPMSQDVCYQAWIIQKLASIQLLIEVLYGDA